MRGGGCITMGAPTAWRLGFGCGSGREGNRLGFGMGCFTMGGTDGLAPPASSPTPLVLRLIFRANMRCRSFSIDEEAGCEPGCEVLRCCAISCSADEAAGKGPVGRSERTGSPLRT